ncbi:MAG: cell division protein FtsI (penicillin-binding protein 3) [Flavobacteriales bacterium]|jgi:cell division protein FtsI (penicillin-binding protein 3)
MDNNKNLLKRFYLVTALLAVLAIGVLVKLVTIQFVEGAELRAKARATTIKPRIVEAARGNIYASDGSLLATSMPIYEVRMDVKTVDGDLFQSGVASLAEGLSRIFKDKSADEYLRLLRKSRNNRYLLIQRSANFLELQQLFELPIYNKGRYKGGLIYEQRNSREMPLGKLAERTIGYDRNGIRVGLEGAFSSELGGREGKRLKQKIKRGVWKPLDDNNAVDPIDGCDLVSTIDPRIQDIAHHALLRQLERTTADHGCIVVMEVATGMVRAIANLGVTEVGTYYEKYNYAIGESTEPGSTFKLMSMIALLEDGKVDTSMKVNTGNGVFDFYGSKMRDSHRGGYGTISLASVFEKSSNIGIAKVIHEAYGKKPQRYVDRLYRMGLHQGLNLDIPGEVRPTISNPESSRWSLTTLPWMSTGYEISMTPLQTLAFYNAVANNGKLIKPLFVKEVLQRGRAIETYKTEVLNPAICSKSTLKIVQALLEGVVERGTASNIRSERFKAAGKTGTCVLNYWKKGVEKEYQASFAGYFPADNPKYSCIVVVNKPDKSIGYYGSNVAAPAFLEVANKIYAATPKNTDYTSSENNLAFNVKGPSEDINTALSIWGVDKLTEGDWMDVDMAGSKVSAKTIEVKNTVPDVRGLPLMDALFLLENNGLKVEFEGEGLVRRQSIKPGTALNYYKSISLVLS